MTIYDACKQLELPNIIDHKLEARMANWVIEISRDDWADSPRTWDNLGVIFVPSGCRYCKNESGLDWDSICGNGRDSDLKALEKMGYIAFPLSVYDHSGVKYYIGSPCDQWDSSQIGWYLVNKFAVYEEWKCKRISPKLRAKIEKIAEGEIDTYNSWANGEVYEFTLFKDGVDLDCVGGIYGDSDEVLNEIYSFLPIEFTDAFTIEEAKEKDIFEWKD